MKITSRKSAMMNFTAIKLTSYKQAVLKLAVAKFDVTETRTFEADIAKLFVSNRILRAWWAQFRREDDCVLDSFV